MIAGTIKGVISQRLVPGANGGRVAVCEILRMTGRVRDMIKDPEQTGQARGGRSPTAPTTACRPSTRPSSATSRPGRVTFDDAMKVASSPHDFKLLLQADGRQGTTMEDVAGLRMLAARLTPSPSPSSRSHRFQGSKTSVGKVKAWP